MSFWQHYSEPNIGWISLVSPRILFNKHYCSSGTNREHHSSKGRIALKDVLIVVEPIEPTKALLRFYGLKQINSKIPRKIC